MAVQQFQEFLDKNKLNYKIIETDGSTHTAVEAAKEQSVPVSNIVKSLLVKVDDEFKLFLVPGDKRLDLEDVKKTQKVLEVRMATADEVKKITGYSIGGVPPFGHKNRLATVIQEGFTDKSQLVAAAGAGNALFRIELKDLRDIINA